MKRRSYPQRPSTSRGHGYTEHGHRHNKRTGSRNRHRRMYYELLAVSQPKESLSESKKMKDPVPLAPSENKKKEEGAVAPPAPSEKKKEGAAPPAASEKKKEKTAPPAPSAKTKEGPVPPIHIVVWGHPWEELRHGISNDDEKSGRRYWKHRGSGKTTYEDPLR